METMKFLRLLYLRHCIRDKSDNPYVQQKAALFSEKKKCNNLYHKNFTVCFNFFIESRF